MNREEFANVITYLEMAVGKPIDASSQEVAIARMRVYFDLLGDLSCEVMKTTAQRIAVQHKWATFPTVGELREAAGETLRGLVSEISPSEAWKLAWQAAAKIDMEIPESLERHTADLPDLVFEAMQAFGIASMVYGKDPVGVIRGQFMEVYEQFQKRDQRLALLPPSVKDATERIGKGSTVIAKPVQTILGQIGHEAGVKS